MLDLTLHDWNASLSMLLYLICNENVFLVESGDMYGLVQKVYCFTPKFHAERAKIPIYDSSFMITQRSDACDLRYDDQRNRF